MGIRWVRQSVMFVSLAIVFLLCYDSPVFSEDKTFNVQEMISNVIKAYGGAQALKEQEDASGYRLNYSFYSPKGEFDGTFILYFNKPDKIREEAYILSQNLSMVKIRNGDIIYISYNGEIINDKALKSYFRNNAILRQKIGVSGLLYLLEHPEQVAYVGEESIQGNKCFGLELPITGDIKLTYFFDAKTFLLVKSIRIISGMTEKTIVYYSDFKRVDKILLPSRMEIFQDERKTSEMIFKEAAFNKSEDAIFEVKDKIKKK